MGTQDQPNAVPNVAVVTAVVEDNFPGLWPAVDLGLSTAATLLLKDNANPVAVIYVGGPSSSKTTVADMFADHPACYVSDNFTPAAFVSHAASVPRGELSKVDLLPRIKHKVLVTPELAPIFRGDEDDLTKRFSIITRVLDGHGLLTDSGTHGQRGYRGDFLFAWLGCTTPFEERVWRVMAQLGSRLFFLLMGDESQVTVADLLASEDGSDFKDRLARVRATLHPFLTQMFAAYGGVRGVEWDSRSDPRPVKERIAQMASLLAATRSEPIKEGNPDRGKYEYTPAKREQPRRAFAVLRNLGRGHALVHGRRQLTEEDLPLLAKVTVSSMPSAAAKVFRALVESEAGVLTSTEVKRALGVRHHGTAQKVMEDLEGRGVGEVQRGEPGVAWVVRFQPEWSWCLSADFRALLHRGEAPVSKQEVCGPNEPVTDEGVCVAPITHTLVQRQREGERSGGESNAHTSQQMTGDPANASTGDVPEFWKGPVNWDEIEAATRE